MDIIQKIKEELQVEKWQVEAAVKLIDEGNTIPFISRYRKEVTGSLNDEQLRNLDERLTYLRSLEDKKEQVLKSIEEQGKLTDELKEKILAAQTLVVVEDLYRPYRPKRKTRASIAKEKGLEPLAEYILRQEATEPVLNEAAKYVSEEKEVKTPEEALQGAQDIIAEAVSDDAACRAERGRERDADKILCPERFCHSSHLAIYYGTVRQRKKDGICGKLSPLRYRSIAFFHFSAGKSSSSAQASR